MLKVLIIAPQNPYPAKDGGKIGIYYPVIHLAKYFEVHFAFITPRQVDGKVFKHFKEHNITIYPQVKNTIDRPVGYLLNFTSSIPYKFQKYCSSKILSKLEAICKQEKIKNVWCNHAHVAWYGLQLKRRTAANIFLREHNIEYMLVQQVMQLQKKPLLKWIINYQFKKTKKFEQHCWKSFCKTFFISDSDFAIAKQRVINDKVKLLYDSVEKTDNVHPQHKEPYSFIFTGGLNTFQNQYNLQKFIDEIWLSLIQKDNRWKLYITGNKLEVLQKQIKADFEKNNIINLGFVDDIGKVTAAKKYFISPTYVGSGLRIKVLNALAGGSVCFVTQIDLEMLSALKDEFNIVKYVTFDEFYSKLLQLESDNALYNCIAAQAAQVGKAFSWFNYAEIVYNEVEAESITGR